MENEIEKAIENWFMGKIHGSIVGTNTQHYNHVKGCLSDLKKAITEIVVKPEELKAFVDNE